MYSLADMPTTPAEVRKIVGDGEWHRHTSGLCPGYTQANLAILPLEAAFEFLVFCQRNPRPCPVLDVTEPGSPHPRLLAPSADVRTDLPLYRIYRRGELQAEVDDITPYWRDDLVAFLLGCSLTFDWALLNAGVPLRHREEDKITAVYVTNIPCTPAGRFHGPLVVSMRPMSPTHAIRATQITSRYPSNHGAPVHIGDPAAIGITDLSRVDYGDAVSVKPGELPVFWACGVTPQAVALESKPELMITHAPGCMFISDVRDAELSVL